MSPPSARRAPSARWGAVLHQGGVVAGGAVLVVVLAAALLLPLQLWSPVVALPVVLVGLALLVRARDLVPSWPLPARPVPAWTAWSTLLVAAGHGLWAGLTHAEHVIIRRDGGSYALYTQWIATRHGLPVDPDLAAFGGAAAVDDPGFHLGSPAYYEVVLRIGDHVTALVVPQFLPGSPAVWSLGHWAGGWTGMLVAPAVVSALAVLAFAGLAARLIGPAAAPVAAAMLALTQPVLHAARSTYSEPVALLLLLAAACLLVDAVRAGNPRRLRRTRDRLTASRLGLAAGLALGLAGLVRVDVVREIALLLPVAAVLALRGHPAARPLVTGTLVGLAFSAGWALLNSGPYLGSIAGSLLPLVAGALLLGAGSWFVVRRGRRGGLRRLVHPAPGVWPPRIATGLVLVVCAVLASRPLWLIVRQDPNDSGSRFVARLQPSQGLAVDGGRTYAEHSVGWVSWWVGPVAVLVAGLVVAGLAGRWTRWWLSGDRNVPGWFGPTFVGFGSTVLSLYRPGITPDHPWADRRLVTVVLPTVVLAATAGLAWAVRRVRGRARPAVRRRVVPLVAGGGLLVLCVPAALATAPVAWQHTERGERQAQEAVCSALGPDDVVLTLDSRSTNEWPQVIRGVCGNPAAVIRVREDDPNARRAAAVRAAERVVAAGGHPVFLAADSPLVLTLLDLEPEHVVDLVTTEDQRLLVERPDGAQGLTVDVWLARWP